MFFRWSYNVTTVYVTRLVIFFLHFISRNAYEQFNYSNTLSLYKDTSIGKISYYSTKKKSHNESEEKKGDRFSNQNFLYIYEKSQFFIYIWRSSDTVKFFFQLLKYDIFRKLIIQWRINLHDMLNVFLLLYFMLILCFRFDFPNLQHIVYSLVFCCKKKRYSWKTYGTSKNQMEHIYLTET